MKQPTRIVRTGARLGLELGSGEPANPQMSQFRWRCFRREDAQALHPLVGVRAHELLVIQVAERRTASNGIDTGGHVVACETCLTRRARVLLKARTVIRSIRSGIENAVSRATRSHRKTSSICAVWVMEPATVARIRAVLGKRIAHGQADG